MKTNAFLTPLLVFIGLTAATTSALFLGRLFLNVEQGSTFGMPPLSGLDLPPQTMTGSFHSLWRARMVAGWLTHSHHG